MERERAAVAFNEENSEIEIDLFDLMHFILRRFKLLVLSGLVGLVLAFIYAFIIATPMYEATAQLYVVNSRDSALDLSDLQIGTYLTSDYELVFRTWEVNKMVIDNLGLDYEIEELQNMVKVTNPSDTRALFITVTSPDPKEATVIANEFAKVGKQYIADTMLSETPTSLSVALEPDKPVSPRRMLILCVGTLLGALICAGLLTISYLRDDKIKTAADLMKYTGAAPLAVVPDGNRRSKQSGYGYGYGYYHNNDGRD